MKKGGQKFRIMLTKVEDNKRGARTGARGVAKVFTPTKRERKKSKNH